MLLQDLDRIGRRRGVKTECPWCIVIASRGPVYNSAEKAGALTATPKPPGVGAPSNRFRTGCNCAVVPICDATTSPYRRQRTEGLSFYSAYPFNGNGVVRNDRDKDNSGTIKQTPKPLDWREVDKQRKKIEGD